MNVPSEIAAAWVPAPSQPAYVGSYDDFGFFDACLSVWGKDAYAEKLIALGRRCERETGMDLIHWLKEHYERHAA
jgi:hypothetical protein